MALDIRDLELNALLEITQAINNNLPEKDLYKIYQFTVLGDLKIKKLSMFVKGENWECKVHFGTSDNWDQVKLPAEFIELDKESSDLADPPFSQFEKAIPVRHKDKLLAMVFAGGFEKELGVDSTFLMALTNILIVAIENKRFARREIQREAFRRELEIAKKVQNFLFPKDLPDSDKLSISALYKPHNNVGGDYYDYIPLSEERFIVCIADVSGKGVPAALLMSNFQASLRTLSRKTQDLREIVTELNHSTFINSNGDHFITFFIALYDFNSASLEYINCGHNPAILRTQDNCVELEKGTTILGMFEPLPFLEISSIEGMSSFVLFGYTDGLSESFNKVDEQFGSERILKLIKESFTTADELQKRISDSVEQFRGDVPLQDDITMISCKVGS